jgi:putative transposase
VISELTGVESAYEIPDVLWDRISSLLPLGKRKRKAGRPRRTGCQWNALPRSLGASSTVHDN